MFSLTKDHGHAEGALPFHLCDNVLHITTTQFAVLFFGFVYDEVDSFPLF